MDTTQPLQLISNHIKPGREEPKEPLVLLCRCGNRTWFLRDDGYPECANCGLIQDTRSAPDANSTWVSHAPLRAQAESPLEAESDDHGQRHEVVTLATEQATQRRILFQIERHWKLLTTHIALYEDGRSSVWCRDEPSEIQDNPQLRDWYKARLEDAANVVLGGKNADA